MQSTKTSEIHSDEILQLKELLQNALKKIDELEKRVFLLENPNTVKIDEILEPEES